jgi:hypothetical protein
MELVRLTASAARTRVLESMGVVSHVAAREREAELLRATLWALSVPVGDEPFREVHVTRLLNRALETLLALDDESDEAALRLRLREVLDGLVAHGDANDRGEGRYLPGSCRLVRLGVGALLVGGIPTSLLPESTRRGLEHNGVTRRLLVGNIDGLHLPEEQLPIWAHIPPEPLASWGAQMCRQPLEKHGTASEPKADELYAPSLARGAHQLRRWSAARREIPDGLYLGRQRRVFGAQEYFLADLRAGVVARSGGVFLPGEWKRFMFYTDLRDGNPLMTELSQREGTLRVKLHGGLPLGEWRLFSALGEWREQDRSWLFHRSEDHPRVVERLRALHVGNEQELRSYE